MQARWSRQVTIVQPGLSIRVNQMDRRTRRQYNPWLDMWVLLTGPPPAPLGGVLGETFPQGVVAPASAGGAFMLVAAIGSSSGDMAPHGAQAAAAPPAPAAGEAAAGPAARAAASLRPRLLPAANPAAAPAP